MTDSPSRAAACERALLAVFHARSDGATTAELARQFRGACRFRERAGWEYRAWQVRVRRWKVQHGAGVRWPAAVGATDLP